MSSDDHKDNVSLTRRRKNDESTLLTNAKKNARSINDDDKRNASTISYSNVHEYTSKNTPNSYFIMSVTCFFMLVMFVNYLWNTLFLITVSFMLGIMTGSYGMKNAYVTTVSVILYYLRSRNSASWDHVKKYIESKTNFVNLDNDDVNERRSHEDKSYYSDNESEDDNHIGSKVKEKHYDTRRNNRRISRNISASMTTSKFIPSHHHKSSEEYDEEIDTDDYRTIDKDNAVRSGKHRVNGQLYDNDGQGYASKYGGVRMVRHHHANTMERLISMASNELGRAISDKFFGTD